MSYDFASSELVEYQSAGKIKTKVINEALGGKLYKKHTNNIALKVSVLGVFLLHIFLHSPYLVRIPENTNQKNSKYGQFSRRARSRTS